MKNTSHISNTPELFLGCGSIHRLHELTNRFKGLVLIISGGGTQKNIPFLQSFSDELKSENRFAGLVKIIGEPSPDDIDDAVGIYRNAGIGAIVAMGGGSVMDAGKAISAMLNSEGSVEDYLEGIGTRAPNGRKVPFIAVPTTAGTGSEATQNAVISRQGPEGFKKSLRHMHYVPDAAVVDPELTISCPPQTTAASGMDAFTQLVESYVSTGANPFTDALALDAIGRVYHSLETACRDGQNVEARFRNGLCRLHLRHHTGQRRIGGRSWVCPALGQLFRHSPRRGLRDPHGGRQPDHHKKNSRTMPFQTLWHMRNM